MALPFGSSAQLPRELAEDRARTVSDLQSIRDVTNLVGSRVFDKLETGGDIGSQAPPVPEGTFVNDYNQVRQPWVLTCQSWIEQSRYLVARVNPSEVQWRLPQRAATQKTRAGEIMHVWRDRFRGTYYDEPQLTISFQSGNIMPIRRKPLVDDPDNPRRVYVGGAQAAIGAGASREVNKSQGYNTTPGRKPDPEETEPPVPQGMQNFYEFLSLVDEQKILDTGDVNYCYIMYNSRMFPNLTLAGLFTPDGVSWSDSADNPNQVNGWSANFTVYDSYPRLNDLQTLLQFYRSAGFARL